MGVMYGYVWSFIRGEKHGVLLLPFSLFFSHSFSPINIRRKEGEN